MLAVFSSFYVFKHKHQRRRKFNKSSSAKNILNIRYNKKNVSKSLKQVEKSGKN